MVETNKTVLRVDKNMFKKQRRTTKDIIPTSKESKYFFGLRTSVNAQILSKPA